ncbi:hypothetical protein D3C71_1514710 [compost metagenome]
MRARPARGFGKFRALVRQHRVGQTGDMTWIVIECAWVDRAADYGEQVAIHRALVQFVELVPELVPPCLLIGQGAAGDHDGAGGLPHGRVLVRAPLSAI